MTEADRGRRTALDALDTLGALARTLNEMADADSTASAERDAETLRYVEAVAALRELVASHRARWHEDGGVVLRPSRDSASWARALKALEAIDEGANDG